MGKYANFYDGVRKLLDKIADALDPGAADTKTANYQTAVLNSLSRIGDKVGDVVSATLPDASTATDGDTLVVEDGEWTIGSGGGGGGGVLVVHSTYDEATQIETLDTTASVIMAAMKSGLVMIVNEGETYANVYPLVSAYWGEGEGYTFIRVVDINDSASVLNNILGDKFLAASGTDYPATPSPNEV